MAKQFLDVDVQTLGSLMKKAREKANQQRKMTGQPEITQGDIAKILKVRKPTVSDWEQGKIHPGFLNVLKYCEALEITPDELLGIHNQRLLNVSLTEQERETMFAMLEKCKQDAENTPLYGRIETFEAFFKALFSRTVTQ